MAQGAAVEVLGPYMGFVRVHACSLSNVQSRSVIEIQHFSRCTSREPLDGLKNTGLSRV